MQQVVRAAVRSGRFWKILGLAGLAGVAATGAVVARDQRRRAALTPEEVRARLRDRLAAAQGEGPARSEEGAPS